jgi:hypothetical protein
MQRASHLQRRRHAQRAYSNCLDVRVQGARNNDHLLLTNIFSTIVCSRDQRGEPTLPLQRRQQWLLERTTDWIPPPVLLCI